MAGAGPVPRPCTSLGPWGRGQPGAIPPCPGPWGVTVVCLHPEGTLILQELLALRMSQPCVLVKMSQPCVLALTVPWQPGVLGLRVFWLSVVAPRASGLCDLVLGVMWQVVLVTRVTLLCDLSTRCHTRVSASRGSRGVMSGVGGSHGLVP